MNTHDTICAISTAQGGAIGLIRVSGTEAIEATDKIFRAARGISLGEAKPYTLLYGNIVDENDDILDEVMVSTFRAPHSYTGENSAEIMCHGSAYILQRVVELLVSNGCRMAAPGEYTQRAFLNGKMDLSQAEAVADLIASSNAANHRLAMNQMRGGFSKELRRLRDQLLEMTSLLELELDFSEEDVEFADRTQLLQLSAEIERVISRLTDSFRLGNALKNGIPVAIIGETNVGKSTLLNQLLHEDKAIVSDVHGTTRDSIEDTITIQGTTFRFIDTAGIRATDDIVENIGIERTFSKIKEAEIILWIIDASLLSINGSSASEHLESVKERILPHCEDKSLICVLNKTDLVHEDELHTIYEKVYDGSGINENETIRISAKNGENIAALENMLLDAARLTEVSDTDIIVTNLRHAEALSKALDAIRSVQAALEANLSGDLISEDLRLCLHHLAEIVGEVSTDEVLGTIFSRFCIGK
jgi:tRNA modification GTPase